MVFLREDAQKILKEEQTTNWQELCLAAIERELPATLRAIAYALLNRDEHGKAFVPRSDKEVAQRHHQEIERRLQQLVELDPDERRSIFSTLFPKIAATVEAAWQLLGHLPYQTGWHRKAFRISAQNQAYSAKRLAWLKNILSQLACYREKDLAWFAAWTPYLAYNTQPFGLLFAAAINAGDAEGGMIFDILIASAHGEHTIGKMGRHVTTGLLVAARQDGWDCIERLLLAAQREEGLRQVILETVDEAHPQAFQRLLRLILEHDLIPIRALRDESEMGKISHRVKKR